MKVPRGGIRWAGLAVVLAGVLITWFSRPDAARSPQAAPSAAFDFYLLAMTLHPAFCRDGHGSKPECRSRQPRPLVIHGLWPENLTPGRYPRNCPAAALDLDAALARRLADFMPGMAENLHEHEWRKHGSCSGLDDDDYFARTLALAAEVEAALRPELTTLAGRSVTAAALRAAAERRQPGIGATITFHCRTLRDAPAAQRQRPFLVEVRQCVDNDGPGGAPHSLLGCATVGRRDQGCGQSFQIVENAGT